MQLIRLVLVLGLTLAPFIAEAQSAGKVARLGVLLFGTPATDPNLAAFVGGLRDLGYVEGRNLTLEYRSAEGRPERVRELALQIATQKPEVIGVPGRDRGTRVKAANKPGP